MIAESASTYCTVIVMCTSQSYNDTWQMTALPKLGHGAQNDVGYNCECDSIRPSIFNCVWNTHTHPTPPDFPSQPVIHWHQMNRSPITCWKVSADCCIKLQSDHSGLLHVEDPWLNGWSFWCLDTWRKICAKAPLPALACSLGDAHSTGQSLVCSITSSGSRLLSLIRPICTSVHNQWWFLINTD